MFRRSSLMLVLMGLVVGCGKTPAPLSLPTSKGQIDKSGSDPFPKTTIAETKPSRNPDETREKLRLRIVPETVLLDPGDSGVQMIAEEVGTKGARRDFTREVRWEVKPPGIATVDDTGYLTAVAPGKAEIVAVHEGNQTSTTVNVEGQTGRGWDFAEDVVPILTRAGCNTGGCHGKGDGQNGFHLSFLGYDPAGDFRAITREALGRRVDLFQPSTSLILAKSTGRTPHRGECDFRSIPPNFGPCIAGLKPARR